MEKDIIASPQRPSECQAFCEYSRLDEGTPPALDARTITDALGGSEYEKEVDKREPQGQSCM